MTDTLGPLRDTLDGLAFAANETRALSDSPDVQAWIAKAMECAAAEVAKARADERERCALICESEPERQRGDGVWAADQKACADAIRSA